jgi:hypothetical protein
MVKRREACPCPSAKEGRDFKGTYSIAEIKHLIAFYGVNMLK